MITSNSICLSSLEKRRSLGWRNPGLSRPDRCARPMIIRGRCISVIHMRTTPSPLALAPAPALTYSMLQVVALHAPDANIAERRFRARFVAPPRTGSGSQKAPAVKGEGEGAQGKVSGEGQERMVTLCMELVHGEGCGVAEEANEVLRCAVFVFVFVLLRTKYVFAVLCVLCVFSGCCLGFCCG